MAKKTSTTEKADEILVVDWSDPDELADHFDDISHILDDNHRRVHANRVCLRAENLEAPFHLVETWEGVFEDEDFELPPLKGADKYPYVLAFSNDPRMVDNLESWFKDIPYNLQTLTATHRKTKKAETLYFVGLESWEDAKFVSETLVWGDFGTFSLNGHLFYSGNKYYDHFSLA